MESLINAYVWYFKFDSSRRTRCWALLLAPPPSLRPFLRPRPSCPPRSSQHRPRRRRPRPPQALTSLHPSPRRRLLLTSTPESVLSPEEVGQLAGLQVQLQFDTEFGNAGAVQQDQDLISVLESEENPVF